MYGVEQEEMPEPKPWESTDLKPWVGDGGKLMSPPDPRHPWTTGGLHHPEDSYNEERRLKLENGGRGVREYMDEEYSINYSHGPPPPDGSVSSPFAEDAPPPLGFSPDGRPLNKTGGPEGGGGGGGAKKSTSRRNAWGNLSYADLITSAIQSSPEKRLTLSQVYDWMVQNIPYFKDKGDSNSSAGWKVGHGVRRSEGH